MGKGWDREGEMFMLANGELARQGGRACAKAQRTG